MEKLPVEYSYGDAMVLDFTHKRSGETIMASEVRDAGGRAAKLGRRLWRQRLHNLRYVR